MRAKTVQRLAILMAVIGLVGWGGYLAWRFQVGRLVQGVLERAARAEEEKDFLKAEELYKQRLAVDPSDLETQLKYADALLKGGPTPRRQDETMAIYEGILKRRQGWANVRRKVAELAVERGQLALARPHLEILLRTAKDDGDLEFLMGRCFEQARDGAAATQFYQAAIDHHAPQRLEACQRRARLLRDQLGQPEEADRVIDAMVQSDPGNYRVYLERGRYRRRTGRPGAREDGAKEDFRQALAMARQEPAVYLELAQVEEQESGPEAARRVLEEGLKAVPDSGLLALALATLELRARRVERAIEVLESSLKAAPDQTAPRWLLALVLADRRETGKLLLHVEELKRIGVHPVFIQYLTAFYHNNKNEYVKALQILTPLRTEVAQNPDLKVRVNLLLARVYGQLNEPEPQQQAYERAAEANPQDTRAQLGLIEGLVRQGAIAQAIEGYRRLLDREPGVGISLARLLIAQMRQLPEPQRDWGEVEHLLADAARDAPGSAEPVILRAQVLLVRGQAARARDLIAAARTRSPGNIAFWIAEADLLGQQKQFDAAMDLLDRARQHLGDQAELRLGRAALWVARGGPQVVQALNDLAQGLEPFSRGDRRRLLGGLAAELGRQQDVAGASRLWSLLAEQEPDELEPRLQLLELAIQAGRRPEIEKNLEEIERIDGSLARYFQARYLIWQAGRGDTRDPQEKERLRSEARAILGELKSRRPDWELIPFAQAQLEEQELAEAGSDEVRKRAIQETLIASYNRAIDLGHRNPVVFRRTVQLLFAAGRGHEALALYNRIPIATQHTGDLGRFVAQVALASREFHQAEEIARQAVAARPGDFQERIWLARILMESGQQDQAEAELRQAVDLARSDPDRWTTLVYFLIQTQQADKAENALRDAEANLPKAPLALALCCEWLGRAYEREETSDQAKKWYGAARRWYDAAQAAVPKDRDDLAVARRLTEFFLRTNQAAEAENHLQAILGRPAAARSAATVAWARRSLALISIAGADPKKKREALALFEPSGRPAGVTADQDPEDLRVLAKVLEAQGTPEYRRRAIEVLEALAGRSLASPEDRLFLARLVAAAGDWPRARQHFRELILRTATARDLETYNRRPTYLALFAEALIRHRRPGVDADLDEALEVLGKLKLLQPDSLAAVLLEVELDRARDRLDEAVALIRSLAGRPKLSPVSLTTLATLAEQQLGQLELAERFYRRLAAEAADGSSTLALARFLGRRDQTKEALDVCEPLWANPRNREVVTAAALAILYPADRPDHPADPAQVDRVIGWLERGLDQDPKATRFLIGLANLSERRNDYTKAEELYRRAIQLDDREGIAFNNLAWLRALRGDAGNEAPDLINHAIQRRGPLPDFLDTRGVVYLAKGNGQSAIDDFRKAVQAAPTASKWFHLAQAELMMNQKEKARKCLEEAKTLGLPRGLHPLEMTAYQKVLLVIGH